MNLRQLHQFLALAETGNFHQAAERLHMAQPPLSVSIRKLEEELGAPLFIRATSGVRLTPMGQAMLSDARQAVFHADQCRQAVTDASQGQGGTLRLGFIGSATYALLPGLIASLSEHLPKVELELTEGTTAEILDRLVARRLDVGLVRYPLLNPGPFELTPLDKDTFVLAVAQKNPLAGRDAITLQEAAHEPFIMYPRDKVPGLCALAMLRCELSGFTPQVVQEAMQVQTIMSLVASGLGVGLVAGVAQRAAPAGVKCLPLTDTPAGFHVGIALVRMADNASRLTQRFIEHALHFTSSNALPVRPDYKL